MEVKYLFVFLLGLPAGGVLPGRTGFGPGGYGPGVGYGPGAGYGPGLGSNIKLYLGSSAV